MALAGGFLNSLDEIRDEVAYELEVVICNDCSLVQIPKSIDPKILFGDYSISKNDLGLNRLTISIAKLLKCLTRKGIVEDENE